ncbi:hypothetical protein C8J56DRAFT_796308, partial [Mycena floridula]
FKPTGEPFHFFVYHCSNCKQASGSSFMANVMFKESRSLKTYKDADTQSGGSTLMRSFCPNCGSSLFIDSSKAVSGNNFIIVEH